MVASLEKKKRKKRTHTAIPGRTRATGNRGVFCGGAIRAARRSLGLTQAELAEKVGCTRVTVSDWETGRYLPSRAIWIALLERSLGFRTGELFILMFGPMREGEGDASHECSAK